MKQINYAFIDEPGIVMPFAESRFFVVSLVMTASPRPIELHVNRMYKKHGVSLASGEMKGSKVEESITKKLLGAIAQESIYIINVIVDKHPILRPPTDFESIYHLAVTRAIRYAVAIHSNLDSYLDQRYTTKHQRYALERIIREGIADLAQEAIIIRQENSMAHKMLQAADFIAWSVYKKYERGEADFYQQIANCIVYEEVIEQTLG